MLHQYLTYSIVEKWPYLRTVQFRVFTVKAKCVTADCEFHNLDSYGKPPRRLASISEQRNCRQYDSIHDMVEKNATDKIAGAEMLKVMR